MTTTTTTAAASYPSSLNDGARIYELRRAMCAWRVDPVNGRARLVKDIARQYAASDHEITRAYLRVSGGFRPNPLVYKDLDAYVAAWRDALVKALRAHRAMVVCARCTLLRTPTTRDAACGHDARRWVSRGHTRRDAGYIGYTRCVLGCCALGCAGGN